MSGAIRLFHNGAVVQEVKIDAMDFAVAELGTYRAEVWLELEGNGVREFMRIRFK